MSLCTNVTLMDCARHIWIRSDIKYDEDIWGIAEKPVKYWSCVNCSAKTKWRVAQKGRVCLITFANVWEWPELLEIVDLSTAVIRLHNRVHSFSRCDDNMFRAAPHHLPNFAQFRCSFRQFSFSKFCFLQISVCSANCLPFAIFAKVCLFKRRQIEWNRDFGRQLSRARSAGTAKKRELPAKCRAFLTCIAQIQEQTQREIQVQIQSQILQLSREKSLECKRGKSRSLSRCIAPFLVIQFIASTNINRNTNTRGTFFIF